MKAIKVTAADLAIPDAGACRSCGELAYAVEPDTRNDPCDNCGKLEVYGLEELLNRGEVEVIE